MPCLGSRESASEIQSCPIKSRSRICLTSTQTPEGCSHCRSPPASSTVILDDKETSRWPAQAAFDFASNAVTMLKPSRRRYMRIALIQLSDIHLIEGSNVVLERLPALAAAAWSSAQETDVQYLLLSGDIANSGADKEYEVARRLITSIVAKASQYLTNPKVRVLAIPGNHDCVLRPEDELRSLILTRPIHELAASESGSSFIGKLCEAQSNFFTFLESVPITPISRTRWLLDYECEGTCVRFVCLNSALGVDITRGSRQALSAHSRP